VPPGYEGVARSDEGLTWQRAKNAPALAVQDPDCAVWERDCIYQPWLVEHHSRFFNFYNAAKGGTEQTGLAFSTDLMSWMRCPANPVIRNRPTGDEIPQATPSGGGQLPARPPLRTVLESSLHSGSSLSQPVRLMRARGGNPAMKRITPSVSRAARLPSANAPGKAPALLEVFLRSW